MSNLAIVVNEELMMEYDRDVALDGNKETYLNALEKKFEEGVELEGQMIKNPDIQQKAQFMSLSLMEGIMYKDEKMASVSLSWLATRLPDLKQVVAEVDHDGTKFELVFDREYKPHINVDFNPSLFKN